MPFEMKDRLGIPIEYADALEEEPDPLVTADCQPGQRNVQRFSGRRVAAIDHHEVRQEGLSALWTCDLRPNCGACSAIIWDLLRREDDFDLYGSPKLITALYYGLFMDTCNLQQINDFEWMDRAARNDLEKWHLEEELRQFKTNNLSIQEVKLVGAALDSVESVQSEALRGAGDSAPDLSKEPLYRKRPVEIGYVRAAEVCEPGAHIKLLMLEGDEIIEVTDGLYLIVGVDCEVCYNASREAFEKRNDHRGEMRVLTPEQLRKVEDAVIGVDTETRPLNGHIRSCTPRGDLHDPGQRTHPAHQGVFRARGLLPGKARGLPGGQLGRSRGYVYRAGRYLPENL